MRLEYGGLHLRIFVHEDLQHGHRPLYEYLVRLAHRQGIAGATVFRGIEGFGQHHHVHTTRLVEVSEDLPIIIELVDQPEPIHQFVASLDGIIEHGTVTISPVQVVKYSTGQES